MGEEIERTSKDEDLEQVSMDEIEAEGATALPDKEVMSLLNVDANVDLGLDLAAPVDLAVAANLNVAAPIDAAASANILSVGSEAQALADQGVIIDQTQSGDAIASAPQDSTIDQVNDTIGETDPLPPADTGDGSVTAGDISATGDLLNVDL